LAQAATVERQKGAPRRGGKRAPGRAAAPRLHLGRLAILILVLVGASFYVAPLRAFFAQQDRYQHAADALQAARADNAAFDREMKLLTTKTYVAQVARADSMLVPPDTQVFVVKGLPGEDAEGVVRSGAAPTAGSISVLDRVEDLWRTLLR
jgi:cell division protein FtsB